MRRPASLLAVLATAVILPATAGASTGTAADVWSGAWPAFIMENGQITDPLGTLTWRQIDAPEGAAYVGKDFGGRRFEGCPAGPGTMYFRGEYVSGGDLIACTTTADGRTITGRFNGNEQLQSGSFTVSIVEDGEKRVFAGKYFEDGGLVVDWCASLVPGSNRPLVVPRKVDLFSPTVRALATSARAGRIAKLRFRVSEAATVRIVVRRAGRTVAAIRTSARAGAGAASWRTPTRLRGARLTFTVVAVDPAGNVSAASAAALRLT